MMPTPRTSAKKMVRRLGMRHDAPCELRLRVPILARVRGVKVEDQEYTVRQTYEEMREAVERELSMDTGIREQR
jgi:hypothetical protein